jgi:predicted membrane metal-binding protein
VVRRDELISPHNKMLSDALTDHLNKKDRRPDKTKDNDRFVTILKGWIDQFALSMTNSDTKNYIQQLLIEPFMEYIFQRAFPYAIIAICIVLSIFIIVIIIFILLLLNRNKCSMCDQLVS